MAKKSNKNQGSSATGASLSDDRQIKDPRTLSRGIGSAFAIAVNHFLDNVRNISGSRNGFLGEDKKEVDQYENLHSSILPKGHNAKKKLME